MIEIQNLALLEWNLTGWRPYAWKLRRSAETGGFLLPDYGPFPAQLPGSVLANLLRHGVVPDWHFGMNSLAVEWVEHRQWMFTTAFTLAEAEQSVAFHADSLDYRGWLLLDGVEVGEFQGALHPVTIELPGRLSPGRHELSIVFDLPPEGQAQLGYTSRAREMKPRYSFSWDWCVRVVPTGAAGAIRLERHSEETVTMPAIAAALSADLRTGFVRITNPSAYLLRATLCELGSSRVIAEISAEKANGEIAIADPKLWWPNGMGAQPLYQLHIVLERAGKVAGSWSIEIGFKRIEWMPCEGAPPDALPWLCRINGRSVFLQGVNWTPIRMCYQDVTAEETERLVKTYRDIGCNLLRVWGGGYLETPEFYAACDRAGLLVWQEFPLSSSGVDSNPPEDTRFLNELERVALHYVRSRRHHVSLLQWCGGNELQVESLRQGVRERNPLDLRHQALAMLARVVETEDPSHRFLPTSPYGPRFHSTTKEFGLGLHHEVHGPWGLDAFPGKDDWDHYWTGDDALFRGETGVAGASRPELIAKFAAGQKAWPPETAYWYHSSAWWTQWDRLKEEFAGMPPEEALPAYCEYTRQEQAEKLAFAIAAKKSQFPRCGGFLIWMGHDAFPCLANTSIVEFDHTLKPAAKAVARVFRNPPGTPMNIVIPQLA